MAKKTTTRKRSPRARTSSNPASSKKKKTKVIKKKPTRKKSSKQADHARPDTKISKVPRKFSVAFRLVDTADGEPPEDQPIAASEEPESTETANPLDPVYLANDRFSGVVRAFSTTMLSIYKYIRDIDQLAEETTIVHLGGVINIMAKAHEDQKSRSEDDTPITHASFYVTGEFDEGEELEKTVTIPIYDESILHNLLEYAETRHVARELLYKQSIQQLSNAFEHFLGDLLRTHLNCFPESAPRERTITYQDLLTCNTLEEAKRLAIDSEVERLAKSSTEEQVELFVKHIGAPASHWKIKNDLVRVLLTRHLLVHADGVASREFVTRAKPYTPKGAGLAVGDQVKLDHEAVRDAWCTCFASGVMLGELCWKKALPSGAATNECEYHTHMAGYESLRFGLSDAAMHVYGFCIDSGRDDEMNRLMSKMNLAIAIRCGTSDDSYKDHVEPDKWSPTPVECQLAAAAIREDHVEFKRLLPIAAQMCDHLNEVEMYRWPAFQWIRNADYYDDLVEKVFGRLPAYKSGAFDIATLTALVPDNLPARPAPAT